MSAAACAVEASVPPRLLGTAKALQQFLPTSNWTKTAAAVNSLERPELLPVRSQGRCTPSQAGSKAAGAGSSRRPSPGSASPAVPGLGEQCQGLQPPGGKSGELAAATSSAPPAPLSLSAAEEILAAVSFEDSRTPAFANKTPKAATLDEAAAVLRGSHRSPEPTAAVRRGVLSPIGGGHAAVPEGGNFCAGGSSSSSSRAGARATGDTPSPLQCRSPPPPAGLASRTGSACRPGWASTALSPSKSSPCLGNRDSRPAALDWSTLSPDTSAQASGLDLLPDRRQPTTPAMSPIRTQSSPFLLRRDEGTGHRPTPKLTSSASAGFLLFDEEDGDPEPLLGNSLGKRSRGGGWEHSLQLQHGQEQHGASGLKRSDVDWLLSTLSSEDAAACEQPDFLEDCHRKFRLLDLKRTGFLSVDDLKSPAFTDMFPTIQLELVDGDHRIAPLTDSVPNLIAAFDTDSDGFISQDEFPLFVKFCQAWRLRQYLSSSGGSAGAAPAASSSSGPRRGRRGEARPPAMPRGGLAPLPGSRHTSGGSRGSSVASLPPQQDGFAPSSASLPGNGQGGKPPPLEPLGRRRSRSKQATAAGDADKNKEKQATLEQPTATLRRARRGRSTGNGNNRGGDSSRPGSQAGSDVNSSRAGSQTGSRGSSRGSSRGGSRGSSRQPKGSQLRTWRDNAGRSREEYAQLQSEALSALLLERQKQQQQTQQHHHRPPLLAVPSSSNGQQACPSASALPTPKALAEEVYALVQGVLNQENSPAFKKEAVLAAAEAEVAAFEAAAALPAVAAATGPPEEALPPGSPPQPVNYGSDCEEQQHEQSTMNESFLTDISEVLASAQPPSSWVRLTPAAAAAAAPSTAGSIKSTPRQQPGMTKSPPRQQQQPEQTGPSLTERVLAVLSRLAEGSNLQLSDVLGQLLWKHRRSAALQAPRPRATIESIGWVNNEALIRGAEDVFRVLAAGDNGRLRRGGWLKVVNLVQRNPVLRQRVHHGDADRLFHSMTSRNKDENRTVSMAEFLQMLLQLVETTATHPWIVFLAIACHADTIANEIAQKRLPGR